MSCSSKMAGSNIWEIGHEVRRGRALNDGTSLEGVVFRKRLLFNRFAPLKADDHPMRTRLSGWLKKALCRFADSLKLLTRPRVIAPGARRKLDLWESSFDY